MKTSRCTANIVLIATILFFCCCVVRHRSLNLNIVLVFFSHELLLSICFHVKQLNFLICLLLLLLVCAFFFFLEYNISFRVSISFACVLFMAIASKLKREKSNERSSMSSLSCKTIPKPELSTTKWQMHNENSATQRRKNVSRHEK